MKLKAAGFLIESNGLYLLGHATQPDNYIFNATDRNWSIPKGIVEPGETLIEGAIRETLEETGLDVRDYWNALPTQPKFILASKNKIDHVFHIIDKSGKLQLRDFYCDSIIENKKFPYMNGKREIDMFIWATRKQAAALIFNTLTPLFSE